jgi:hypothetical protein
MAMMAKLTMVELGVVVKSLSTAILTTPGASYELASIPPTLPAGTECVRFNRSIEQSNI